MKFDLTDYFKENHNEAPFDILYIWIALWQLRLEQCKYLFVENMHRRSYVSGQGFTWKNEISYASIRYMCILYAHDIRASALKSQSRFYLEKGNSVHYDTFKTTNSMFHLSRTVQISRKTSDTKRCLRQKLHDVKENILRWPWDLL